MRIGIAQINTHAGDFSATAARVEGLSRSASEQGVDLLLFPLATLTGPQPVEYASQEGSLLDLSDTLVTLSDAVACPCIVPMVSDMDGSTMAEAMLLRNGEALPLRLLSGDADPSSRDVRKLRWSEPQEVSTFEFGGLRFALGFTYDDLDSLIRSEDRVDVTLFFSGYGYALDDSGSVMGAALAENRYRADASSLDAWFVGIAPLGGYGTQVYTGSSFVLSPQGDLVASSPAFEEALLVCDVDASAGQPVENVLEPEIYNRTLHLWESLSLALHDFVGKAGLSDVAFVLDGSLASDLLATLASDALGPRHVHALVASGVGDARLDAARSLAESLRIHVEELPQDAATDVDEPLRTYLGQARLAAYASGVGALALSCEDKTHLAVEAELGACHASGLLPFGDVYRTDLIELAHLRNTISPVIPASAFQAFDVPAVDGLESAEPTPQMRLERVDVTLATHIEWERCLSDVVARQGEKRVTLDILRRLRDREEARMPYAPPLMMSSRTLFDARMPLGYAWRDRLRSEDERVRGNEMAERLSAMVPGPNEEAEGPRKIAVAMEGLAGGLPELPELPEGIDRSALESSIGDLLGLIQDLLQNGNPTLDGPSGPFTWGSPFSEN